MWTASHACSYCCALVCLLLTLGAERDARLSPARKVLCLLCGDGLEQKAAWSVSWKLERKHELMFHL